MLPFRTLAISPAGYFLLQSLLTRRLRRSHGAREACLIASKIVGAGHSLFAGTWALREMLDPKWQRNDLIHTASGDGERIIALEWGYLLQDTLYLLLHRRDLDSRFVSRILAHHIVVFSLLSAYLHESHHGRASGVFFVSSFIALNLSTPLRYLVWGVKRYSNHPRLARMLHALAMMLYAAVRFGLLWYQVWVYGQRKGLAWWDAFRSLRPVCRAGISTLFFASLIRFAQICRSNVKRTH